MFSRANLWVLILPLLAMGCGTPNSPPLPEVKTTMSVTSSTFSNNQPIPTRCSANGGNISPALAWTVPPSGTKSLTLVMEDPDAPGPSPFVHWVLFNIPGSVHQFKEGQVPAGAVAGKNSNGSNGYYGPNPPNGTHHYHVRVYALDSNLPLSQGASKADVVKAMKGHELGMGEITGLYEK